jgi:hypothetical protein
MNRPEKGCGRPQRIAPKFVTEGDWTSVITKMRSFCSGKGHKRPKRIFNFGALTSTCCFARGEVGSPLQISFECLLPDIKRPPMKKKRGRRSCTYEYMAFLSSRRQDGEEGLARGDVLLLLGAVVCRILYSKRTRAPPKEKKGGSLTEEITPVGTTGSVCR